MSTPDAAVRHYWAEEAIAARTFGAVRGLWSQVDPFDVDRSWLRLLPRAVATVTVGQMLATQEADAYVTSVLVEQGIDPTRTAEMNQRALAGVSASDDRLLAEVLREPVIATKVATAQGTPTPEAVIRQGAARLAQVIGTQMADTARGATSVAMTATPSVSGYVRMLSSGACSRCVILAGKFFRWNTGFQRHPRCSCTHIPAREDTGDDARTDPQAYFESLTPADQDRIFTSAGAQAIRDGADMNQVVNARRGMYRAGARPIRPRSTRPLPEQIYDQAGDDRAQAVELLRRHGYLV